MTEKAPKIEYSRRFNKQLKKLPLQIKIAYRRKILLFLNNPFDPLLNNHALTGILSGNRSINITGDWRIIFHETYKNKQKVCIFSAIGTHSQLYK